MRVALVGLLLAVLGAASAAQPMVLTTAPELTAAPKWVKGPSGQSGFCAELMSSISDLSGELRIDVEPNALPQKRLEADVQTGRLDLICALTRIPEREQIYHFIEPETYRMPYVLVARADDTVEAPDWDAVRALGERGVVLLNHDSSRLPVLRAMGGLRLLSSGLHTEASLRMLLAGRGRFFYFPLANVQATAKSMGLQHCIRVLQPPMQTEPYFLLVGRQVPEAKRERLSQAMLALQRSGALQRLEQRWLYAPSLAPLGGRDPVANQANTKPCPKLEN